jgi:hypothetical protein
MQMKISQIPYFICAILPLFVPFKQHDIHKSCGLDADSQRVLKCKIKIPPDLPGLRLKRVNGENEVTSLIIEVFDARVDKYYISLDRGKNWEQITNPSYAIKISNIPVQKDATGRFSNSPDSAAIYQFSPSSHCIDSVSTDAGKTWMDVTSRLENGRSIDECLPIGVYGEHGKRIYIWIYDKDNKGLWVSNDYGQNFRFLTSTAYYVVESPSNPSVMYGIGDNTLQKSYDAGKNWEKLPASEFMFKPVFIGTDAEYRTWDPDGLGNEDGYPYRIEHLQTDPQNSDVLYALTCKGLFRSTDGGKSFVLLPLGADKLSWIDKIAVDPMDGKYLYAQCGMNSLYRSNDYGCSWVKLKVPLP